MSDGKHRSLRWVRSVLGRSLGMEQRRSSLQAAAVDAQRGGAVVAADPELSPLMQQRAELGARLLVHDPATQTVRNLFLVHDELRARGWPGVEGLPLQVVGRALAEAEMLASDEPSPLLATIIDSLRALTVAAEAQAAHDALERDLEFRHGPEVSETNYDEYELMERSWVGTVPAGLESPRRSV